MINKHAPKTTKEVKIVDTEPWFDAEYKALRRQRGKAERKYKQSGNLDERTIQDPTEAVYNTCIKQKTTVLHISS